MNLNGEQRHNPSMIYKLVDPANDETDVGEQREGPETKKPASEALASEALAS